VDVTPDELTRPLGLPAQKAKPLGWPRTALALVGLGALALIGLAVWITVQRHAEAPFAVAPVVTREVAAPSPGPAIGPRQSAEALEDASGVSVHRPPGEVAPGSVVIRVPDMPVKLAPAPDPGLVEPSRFGLLPKTGPDGARPAQVYARPAPATAGPRVEVVVGGLGIGPAATVEAIAKLPPSVTLAFAPYGDELDRFVARARDEGHEVMLQIPMEPFDYPANDPGPHTLTVRAKPQETLERLQWVMARFTGYTGLVTFMGARLTADEAALAPILREAASRGLLVLDDGSSSRSVIRTGTTAQVPTLRAQAVVDAVARPDAIDRELARLEDTARSRGFAIGTASALPMSVDRIARWAKALESKGIELVPVSALAGQGQ
jgi:polysaccharide deacetylase 2 family uncharacterized protein YibQ